MISGRKNWQHSLRQTLNDPNEQVAWFHCASLGEFEQGRPIIERFSKAYPEFKIVLTFYSPSGYEIRKNYPLADLVLYLPWDTPTQARLFISTLAPRIAFIIKYEYWYHMLRNAYQQGIPVLLCSAIFRQEQIFFKPYGSLFRRLLHYFDQLFVQDQSSRELLAQINISKVTVAGDTRMDRVKDITRQVAANSQVERFISGWKNVMVVGSSWPEDVEVLAPLINKSTEMKFIIAPHETDEVNLRQIEKLIRKPHVRYTSGGSNPEHQVLIIDTIGLLSSLYQYGNYAYIGGAFGKGLHNILEAATFGLPLFFGNKNYRKFREARDLLDRGGARTVANTEQLQEGLLELMRDPRRHQQASQACRQYVTEQIGATEKIMDHVSKILNT